MWRFPRRRELLLIIALAMLAVVAFDAREVVLPADENRGGPALLAGLIGALHLAAAAIAAMRPTALRRVTATMGR